MKGCAAPSLGRWSTVIVVRHAAAAASGSSSVGNAAILIRHAVAGADVDRDEALEPTPQRARR